ncbi:MAG: molybdopterin-guanine dinucleotide biosynthesis protein B [Alphaproteobacteria bacterium]|nr:molybdopterin-guanine dinucleotide biosynthesis protein B [Alphaproteobacteria bacterium]MCY4318152.1 molybdopterin-guanine dinucleotide biosynthesis protein B [Alphaproteobacteria bacterium]
MKMLGIVGWSGSGKTTLLRRLIPALQHRGVSVSTIKHAHHDFDVDKPGKDSWEHRQAGAREVLVTSGRRWALMHELREEAEPPLADLLARLSPVDLVLVEGYKRAPHPKLMVHRAAADTPPLWPGDPDVLAVACDGGTAAAVRADGLPALDLDDSDVIADFIVKRLELGS